LRDSVSVVSDPPMPARTFPQGYRDREPVDNLRHAGSRTNLQAKSVPHRLVTSEHPTHLPVAITRQPDPPLQPQAAQDRRAGDDERAPRQGCVGLGVPVPGHLRRRLHPAATSCGL